MKRTAISILLLAAVLTALCGCAEKPQTGGGYTFTDDLGRTVTVSSPKRVAPLLGSFADIWMLAGGTVCATADDAWDDLHLDLPKDAVNLGGTKNPSLEKLLAAQPDFVIASTSTKQHIEWKETLEAVGITVAYFDVSGFDDYLRVLKVCTDITGRTDLYQKNGAALEADIAKTVEKSQARIRENGVPRVLFLRASASSVRAKGNGGTVLGEMLSALGCENIADRETSLLENLSLESIIQENPDRIFIVQVGDDFDGMKKAVSNMFSENPAWNELDAVKNGRVYYLDKRLYNMKPNARWSEAYEKLEELLSEK